MKISFCSVLKTNAFISGLCSSQRLYLCSFGPSSLLIASIPYPQSKNVKVMQIQTFFYVRVGKHLVHVLKHLSHFPIRIMVYAHFSDT